LLIRSTPSYPEDRAAALAGKPFLEELGKGRIDVHKQHPSTGGRVAAVWLHCAISRCGDCRAISARFRLK
jgi:hypothetical protein